MATRRLVAITGARGNVGRRLWPDLQGDYTLRLLDRREFDGGENETILGDFGDREIAARLCERVDTLIHLAADPRPHAEWESLVPANILGVHTLFAAAKAAGVRRVLFASSVNASLRAAKGEQMRESDAPEPTNLYGATKVMGEALASVFGEIGPSFIGMRIGAYAPEIPQSLWMKQIWTSPRDFNAFVRLAIEWQGTGSTVVHVASENRIGRLSLARAKSVFGYAPQDDAFAGELA